MRPLGGGDGAEPGLLLHEESPRSAGPHGLGPQEQRPGRDARYRVRAAAAWRWNVASPATSRRRSAVPPGPSPERPVPPPPPPEAEVPDLPVPRQPQASRVIVPNAPLEDARRVMAWYKKQQPAAPRRSRRPGPRRNRCSPRLSPAEPPCCAPRGMATGDADAGRAGPGPSEIMHRTARPAGPRLAHDVLGLLLQAWQGE